MADGDWAAAFKAAGWSPGSTDTAAPDTLTGGDTAPAAAPATGADWASAFKAAGWRPEGSTGGAGRFEIPPALGQAAGAAQGALGGGLKAAGTGVDRYLDLARETAARHGLNPSLLAAVWDFESSGNPGAINKSSGATGLGQVMPREAGFAGRPTRAELLDPATNAEWSARILKSGLERYGSEDKALAAYLGAIDARGNITGAVDANGTGGNQYIQQVRARQQKYGGSGFSRVPGGTEGPSQGGSAPANSLTSGDDWVSAFRATGWSPDGASRGGGGSVGPSSPSAAAPAQRGDSPDWLRTAEAQLGKPYIWGSKGGRSDFSAGAAGFDCSGFVSYVYKTSLGVDLPAFTGSAYPATQAISPQEAKAGDLVFYNMGIPDPRRQHVAIYLGDGRVIQSGGAGDGVNIAPVNQIGNVEFRRSPQAQAALARGQTAVGSDSDTTATGGGPLYLQGTIAPGGAGGDWVSTFTKAGWRP